MIGFRTSTENADDSAKYARSSTTGPASVVDEVAIVPRYPTAQRVQRTLEDVRDQVSQEIAVHTITKAKTHDGVRIAVKMVLSKNEDEDFLRQIAEKIQHQMRLQEYLIALATTAQSVQSVASTLIICGSSPDFVQRADDQWVASVLDLGVSPYDEDALWDVVQKASRAPINPLAPPPGSRGIDEILSEARARLQRITPSQAFEELRESQVGAPTFLVDIRPQEQREREGGIHGSLIIERNVLEWRFDPRCASHLAIADRYDLRIIVFCQEGYTSSLAAYSLQQIGLLNATDIIGGYEAWKNEGLPIDLDRRDKTRSFV
ncbi:hypothetical protein M413DRAFT_20232 [Hebeloma cylindrosporum]|uniref:Rhodanese domain-containing protein n=1 Tax=Hebeloma cylindrosporum TaxID=76867 RepID=A0A0C3C2G1_HEBCY|nr:hypothetical protein M413DRAFT_20232 [Hebeloma cylindrosporum h7]